MTSEAQGWLVAVFESECVARDAAHKTRRIGADPDAIRIGDPIDALTSIRGELREEVNDIVGTACWPPRRAVATVITLPLAASAGVTLAVPDTASARHVLEHSGSVRIDVVAPDGRPVDTLKARGPRHGPGEQYCTVRRALARD
jgi:hypothetical protein